MPDPGFSFTITFDTFTGRTEPEPRVAVPQQPTDLNRTQAAVSFGEEQTPDMTGFSKHWSLGSTSAWFNTSKGDVLVIDSTSPVAVKVSGLPQQYGRVIAAGWEGDQRFFVHLSRGADTGTMVYCDLIKKEVTEVKHWGAW